MQEELKEDLRVVRTRKLLCKALFELLEEVPFDKISVTDICDKAMVHRATFYNHFESKEHLLEYAIDELKEGLFSAVIEKEKYASSKDMYMSLVSNVIDFASENKPKILLVLKQNSYEKIMGLLLTTIRRSVKYLLSKNEYNEEYTLPKNILIDFLSGGITTIGLAWLQSSNPDNKEDLLKYFDIILNENIFIKK